MHDAFRNAETEHDAACVTDRNWTILDWNATAEATFGRTAKEALGHNLRDLLPASFSRMCHDIKAQLDSNGFWCNTLEAHDERKPLALVYRFVNQQAHDGGERHILLTAIPQSPWTGIERRETHEPAHAMFERLFGSHPDGVVLADRDGRICSTNQQFCALTGFTPEALHGEALWSLVSPSQKYMLKDVFAGVLRGTPHTGEFTLDSNDHKMLECSVSLIPNIINHGVASAHVIVKDIHVQKQDQRHILYLANHDALTGLANRRLLLTRMQHTLESARRNGDRFGILFLDLNRFKVINDSMGHDMGDEVLRTTARRICDTLRDVDTAARMGGDEFVVILENVDGVEAILHVARELSGVISLPIRLGGEIVQMTTSIGVAMFPDDGETTTTLLKNADLAMYAAKESGRSVLRRFDPSMGARALGRLSSENALRDAISGGRMVLHYQPRLSLVTNQIVAVEALVRWDSATKGLIYPTSFIGLAEETGLIVELGEWVLNTACAQMADWHTRGMQAISVSVNMSAVQLQSPDIGEMVARVIAQRNFDPRFLEIELTESTLMGDIEASIARLSEFRSLGISLSIDDFGTGYSSLSYLKRLPVSLLKIDKSFVRDVAEDSDDAAIVSATIAMAHSMEMEVVAEGVTTFEQLRFLEARQCDQVQGFLVCQPLPASEMEAYLRSCQLRGIQYAWSN